MSTVGNKRTRLSEAEVKEEPDSSPHSPLMDIAVAKIREISNSNSLLVKKICARKKIANSKYRRIDTFLNGIPVINFTERRIVCDVSPIIAQFNFGLSLDPVEHGFRWTLNYKPNSLEEIITLNIDMLHVTNQFCDYGDAPRALKKVEVLEENFKKIHASLLRLSEELTERPSHLKELKAEASVINNQMKVLFKDFNAKYGDRKYYQRIESSMFDLLQYENTLFQWLQSNSFTNNVINSNKEITMQLLYRASRDGFSIEAFQNTCYNKGSTLTIIRSSNGYIFGGFASSSWGNQMSPYCNIQLIRDPRAFIFTLKNPSNLLPTKFISNNYGLELFCSNNCGPAFGYQLSASNQLLPPICDIICMSGNPTGAAGQIGFPSQYIDTTGLGCNVFTGSKDFIAAEIEVFLVNE